MLSIDAMGAGNSRASATQLMWLPLDNATHIYILEKMLI
jgi:hypothetical protein